MTIELKPQEVIRTQDYLESIRKIRNCLCSDGKQRMATTTAPQADSYFSIPAYVAVKGKKVTGFLVRETLEGYDTETENDPAVWKFIAYTYRKNHAMLPRGAYKENG